MRTIEDIYKSIITEVKATTSTTSVSKLSIISLIAYIIASAIFMHEQLFFAFKKEQDILSRQQKYHNELWYQNLGKRYQDGSEIKYIENEFRYEQKYLEANNPIKFIAINERPAGLVFKIAGADSSGKPIQLQQDIIHRFTSYLNKFKDAGTSVDVVSRPADQLKIDIEVWVEPQLINIAGELVSDKGIKPIEVEIKKYLQNLPWDGSLSSTFLFDTLAVVPGVLNLKRNSILSKFGLTSWKEIDQYHRAYGGYFDVVSLKIKYRLNAN